MLVPVILAGGIGSRLWPLSRESYPKQFMPLLNGKSLFQKTLERALYLQDATTIVLGSEAHRFLLAEQIRVTNTKPIPILIEPSGRSTAPAVALAAFYAIEKNPDAVLLIMPGDHLITDTNGFRDSVMQGMEALEQDKLVTFGVEPISAETGYGYIEKGAPFKNNVTLVHRFVEKPNLEKAKQFLLSGNYYWNSGIFLFKASVYLEQLEKYAPEIYTYTYQSFKQRTIDNDFIRPEKTSFEMSPSNSIDYAVMEKTDNAVVVPLSSSWKDVGAWDALTEIFDKDNFGNVCQGDVLAFESKNCFIQSKDRLVVALGVENLIVVETPDAVLVLNKSHSQSIKTVVSTLKEKNRTEATQHQLTHRPWGSFESIDCGERFQVKHITVNVGGKLSLQRHHHRSEHWVVVKGTAKVTCGKECFFLSENQSTYIPIGVTHRLENVGKIPLEMIEVQSGAYLGEDDIERLDDQYGRESSLIANNEVII